jgi:hypothetical protein
VQRWTSYERIAQFIDFPKENYNTFFFFSGCESVAYKGDAVSEPQRRRKLYVAFQLWCYGAGDDADWLYWNSREWTHRIRQVVFLLRMLLFTCE